MGRPNILTIVTDFNTNTIPLIFFMEYNKISEFQSWTGINLIQSSIRELDFKMMLDSVHSHYKEQWRDILST